MAAIDEMPFSTSAYLGDTLHLTTCQHGAYFLILLSMWRSGGYLPNDDKFLAQITKQSVGKWRSMAKVIRKLLMVSHDGASVSQKRLLREWGQAVKSLSGVEIDAEKEIAKLGTFSNIHAITNNHRLTTIESKNLDSVLEEKWTPNAIELKDALAAGFSSDQITRMIVSFSAYHKRARTPASQLSSAWRKWVDNEIRFERTGTDDKTGRSRSRRVQA